MRLGSVPALTTGSGFTVIVKLIGVPTQVVPLFVKLGVTVIVPVIGAPPVFGFVAVKLRLPVPLAARPIAGFVFVQLYTVPVVAPLKLTATGRL